MFGKKYLRKKCYIAVLYINLWFIRIEDRDKTYIMAEAKISDFKDYQGPTSREYTVDIDLAGGDTIRESLWFDFLSCKTIAITVQLIGATGTSGNVLGTECGIRGTAGIAYSTPVSITMANNAIATQVIPQHLARYFRMDLTGITWGTVGKVKIVLTGKPH